MGYIRCPGCGNMNREIDPKCYNCEADLTLVETDPSGAMVNPTPPAGPAPIASKATTTPVGDYGRDSTWVHGLRSGAVAGLMLGVFNGLFWGMFGAMLGGAVTNSAGGMALGGFIVFAIVLVQVLFEGIVIGVIAGALNELCYQHDAAKIGFYVGIAFGLWHMFSGGSFFTLLWDGGFGAALGWLASFSEKKFFRKQYAESGF